jgi:hypothetical protein
MALVVRLQITASDALGLVGLDDIETLEIRRLTHLHSSHPDDERHEYLAVRYSPTGDKRAEARFRHRYGDGAWMCVLRALMALRVSTRVVGQPLHELLSDLIPEEPS